MADNMEVDESAQEESRQEEAQTAEKSEEQNPSVQSESKEGENEDPEPETNEEIEPESNEESESVEGKGDGATKETRPAEGKSVQGANDETELEGEKGDEATKKKGGSDQGVDNETELEGGKGDEATTEKRECNEGVNKESPPKAQPVYRRKPKKTAKLEEASKSPTKTSPAKSEPEGLEKGESVKKRKPGFQKRDKSQEDVALVKKEGQFEIGDLVWTKLKGHPWWPSQVFDPEKASKKAKKLEKPGHLLIAFFGDETFAWHKPEDLVPYEENFEVKSQQQGGGKVFQRAIEGAQEELERQKAVAQGIIIEDPEEREMRLRQERAVAEKEAIAAYDPERMLLYIRALAAQPVDGPSDEPSRIQALAYRSVTFHEEKEHPAKAGVLPGWRPILKEPKRKVKAVIQEESDEDVPILATARTPKTPKPSKADDTKTEVEGNQEKKRGWPKGKPRGKKTAVDESPEDAVQKKRRRKKRESVESGGTKFDQLVAAIDDIEGRENETEESAEKNEEVAPPNREVKKDANGSTPERKLGEAVHIPAPKVKRASREEAGAELGALLDKLRAIAQNPLANDVDNKSFQESKYFEYRRYQIGRTRLRYQRAFSHPIAASPKFPKPSVEKRKALDSVAKSTSEGGQVRKRKDPPAVKKEGDDSESVKVKRVRKRKESVDGEEPQVKKEKVKREEKERVKKEESIKKEQKEETESSDEDVPLHKRMKVSPAETALPPRKQVGTATAAERIAENRRRMLGVKEASERKEASDKASLSDKKASEKEGRASETPAKPFEPLAVFMRFPERFAVPSEAQLKASFVRFGELATYYGATRVLPHKSSAQVVFKSSDDAQRAFNYCRKNEMFGSNKIRYELREVILQDVAKRGRLNGGESVFNKMTYDELLKGPTKAAPYRPINSRPAEPVFLGAPQAVRSVGSIGGPKSILKDPRRSMQDALLKPMPLQPPPTASPPAAYATPRGAPEPPAYPPQPPAYAPHASSYAGQSSAYVSQSIQPQPYAPPQPSGSAPAYGPRPPAYGPNQSQPPAYASRPSAYSAFNQPSSAGYQPAPPLPPYPRGQQQPRQVAPPPPPYGQPPTAYKGPAPAVGGQFAGQTLPPPPPPMLSAADMQQLASVLNAFPSQISQTSQGAQLLPPPPPPMPPQDPRRQEGGENAQQNLPSQGEPASVTSNTDEAGGGAIDEPALPEDPEQFRDMLEQLLNKAAHLTGNI